MIRSPYHVIKFIFLANAISKFQKRPSFSSFYLIRLVSSRPNSLVSSRVAHWSRRNFLGDPTFIFRKSCRFAAITWSVARYLIPAKHARQARYCPPLRDENICMSAIMRQSSCLWCRKEFSPLATAGAPVWRLIVFESGSYRVPPVFKRIPTTDSRIAETFFFYTQLYVDFKPGKSGRIYEK